MYFILKSATTIFQVKNLKHGISPGVSRSEPLGAFKIKSAFHPSEVDQMSTKNSWGLKPSMT